MLRLLGAALPVGDLSFLLALLASGYSPIYPCHVPPRDMRTHPIGIGPFKFVEFKPNERITVTRNPDYWKKDRPYLDGIEYTIIKDPSTRVLAFIAGKFDTDFSLQCHDSYAEGFQERDTGGDLRAGVDECQPYPDPKPRQAVALAMPADAQLLAHKDLSLVTALTIATTAADT